MGLAAGQCSSAYNTHSAVRDALFYPSMQPALQFELEYWYVVTPHGSICCKVAYLTYV